MTEEELEALDTPDVLGRPDSSFRLTSARVINGRLWASVDVFPNLADQLWVSNILSLLHIIRFLFFFHLPPCDINKTRRFIMKDGVRNEMASHKTF